MAVNSLSAAVIPPFSLFNSSSSLCSNSKFVSLYSLTVSGKTLKFRSPKPLHSSTRVYAAPEVLDSPEPLDPPPETLHDESDSTTFEVGDSEYFVN